ncbi:MAG: nitroreductase family deazaflavin-dependent oxidoreductase [Anaerolineaceae bacterium]|nr:nitroreductase family deazaflavin-dependent oxidoreductase [Anaerolineaceae bacterium]
MLAESKVEPPHPIPYPSNTIIRKLYRTPILLYRLGLGQLFGKYIMIISTFGRKSGKVRRTPIEYFRQGDFIYAISGFERDPDWYQNLKAHPYVTLQTGQGTHAMFARRPETAEEWQGALDYLKESPVPALVIPEVVEHLDDPEIQAQIREWPVVIFEPTEEPCPEPLAVDLYWAWPLILLALAFEITFWWLISRKK